MQVMLGTGHCVLTLNLKDGGAAPNRIGLKTNYDEEELRKAHQYLAVMNIYCTFVTIKGSNTLHPPQTISARKN